MILDKLCPFLSVLIFILSALAGRAQQGVVQLVHISDVHYGITRPHFRDADSVRSMVVNRAMLRAIDLLPGTVLPSDNGIGAGGPVGYIDGLVITGDIANRQEKGIQSAAASWREFEANYLYQIHTKTSGSRPTPLYLLPGNHDISDAVGYYKPFYPFRDATAMAGIYNNMLQPDRPRTKVDYDYARDKVHYKRDVAGVHLLFINLWPDSAECAWMEKDFDTLRAGVPVILFAHSIPDVEARFFTNPNGDHGIDSADKFENLLPEWFRDGERTDQPALEEQRGFVSFLKRHPAIKAYFHGHNNYTEFYLWHGPDNDIALPCFRVDSPMKGKFSSKDETLLSFFLISIDTKTLSMTVRECLWNSSPGNPSFLKWGETTTLSLR